MRIPLIETSSRRSAPGCILEVLRERRSITVGAVELQFGVSPMTARRDLATLVREGHARRTHGGAVLPDLAAHEDSFRHRLDLEVADKERLAGAVVFRSESDVFGYFEADDLDSAARYLAAQSVSSRWQDSMAELLAERVPDGGPEPLEQIFRLD